MAAATPMFIADARARPPRHVAAAARLRHGLCPRRGRGRELIRAAVDEGRILLTRNTRLLRRRALPPHVFVASDDFRAQLRQVVEACGLDARARVSGALRALQHTARASSTAGAAARACRAYVCATQSAFARCPTARASTGRRRTSSGCGASSTMGRASVAGDRERAGVCEWSIGSVAQRPRREARVPARASAARSVPARALAAAAGRVAAALGFEQAVAVRRELVAFGRAQRALHRTDRSGRSGAGRARPHPRSG